MPQFLSELLTQLRGIWGRLDGGQRLTISAVVLAALVGLAGIVWFAGQPNYETVFRAEDPRALDDAIRALGTAGIGFKEDGSRLLVERESLGKAHGALFRAGVTGGDDPEREDTAANVTLDRLGRIDKQKVKDNKRAEHAVEMITGVLEAYVTSSKPKRSVYTALDKDNRPSATVTLVVRRGEAWRPIAARAIEAVASAVGIPEQYVTAINARTKASFKIGEAGFGTDGNDFLAQQRKRSMELSELAQAWLDRLYQGKAIVTVAVDLDPSYKSSERKITGDKVLVSEDKTKDSTEGGSSTPVGDPSVASGSAAPSGPTGASTKSETSKKKFEPFIGVERIGMLTPDIRRMTIALVLDESIDAAKHKSIEDAIKRTVGFSEVSPRQDELTTLVEKFPEIPEPEVSSGPGMMDLVREFGPLAGQVLGVILVLLFLRKLLRSPATGASSPAAGSASSTNRGGGESSGDDEKTVVLTPEESRRNLRREIEKSISDDPAAMSRILESWLAETKS